MLSARESRMETYEQIYQELRNNDKSAWTGDGYPWAWEKLTETLDSLAATGHLPEPGSHILELGRGNGLMASLCFARKGHHVCALVQLEDNCFDLIFDGSCMHCLTGSQREQAYSQVRRLLRENGTFIISSMCGEPG